MSGSTRVLFVDDDPAIHKLYRGALKLEGIEMVSVLSGMEGVETCERETFDAVIMDLNMPGLDGWMAMSLIRARCPNLPMVVLTSASGSDLEARARTAGAAGFLSKPCSPESLARAIKRAIA